MKSLPQSSFYRLFVFTSLLAVAVACSKDDDPTGGLTAPVAIDATDLSGTGFVANWESVPEVTGYQLDVSEDNFATFVTKYNSKAVTATTETVTGLTPGTTYKYRVRSVKGNSTSANSNEITVTTYGPVAKIGGAEFTPNDLTITDTNIGLELHMTDADNDITIRLSDKVAGTYQLLSTVPTGRTEDVKTAIAMWVNNKGTFFGESGSIVVTISGDGKVSLTFNATGESVTGTSSTISDGKLDDASVTPAGIAQCSLTSFAATSDSESSHVRFGYDSEGRLIQYIAEGGSWNYFWTDSRITRALLFSDFEVRQETWKYEGNVITGVSGISANIFTDGTYEVTYTYTGGKLTKAERDDGFIVSSNTITYDGDNVSTIDYAALFFGSEIDSYTDTYSAYDSKNNFWQLLVKSTNNPIPTGFEDSIDGSVLGKNNVGQITRPDYPQPEVQTFTYGAYTSAGYPGTLTYTSSNTPSDNYSATMAYAGCN